MKTLKQLLNENKPVDASVKKVVLSDIKKHKLDGNGRFNTLSKAKSALEDILFKNNLSVDSEARFDLIFSGDSDIIDQKGRGAVLLKNTKNQIVISWEHRSNGYSLEAYLS